MNLLGKIGTAIKSIVAGAPKVENVLTPEYQTRIQDPNTPASQRIAQASATQGANPNQNFYKDAQGNVFEATTGRHIELPEFQRLGLNIDLIPSRNVVSPSQPNAQVQTQPLVSVPSPSFNPATTQTQGWQGVPFAPTTTTAPVVPTEAERRSQIEAALKKAASAIPGVASVALGPLGGAVTDLVSGVAKGVASTPLGPFSMVDDAVRGIKSYAQSTPAGKAAGQVAQTVGQKVGGALDTVGQNISQPILNLGESALTNAAKALVYAGTGTLQLGAKTGYALSPEGSMASNLFKLGDASLVAARNGAFQILTPEQRDIVSTLFSDSAREKLATDKYGIISGDDMAKLLRGEVKSFPFSSADTERKLVEDIAAEQSQGLAQINQQKQALVENDLISAAEASIAEVMRRSGLSVDDLMAGRVQLSPDQQKELQQVYNDLKRNVVSENGEPKVAEDFDLADSPVVKAILDDLAKLRGVTPEDYANEIRGLKNSIIRDLGGDEARAEARRIQGNIDTIMGAYEKLQTDLINDPNLPSALKSRRMDFLTNKQQRQLTTWQRQLALQNDLIKEIEAQAEQAYKEELSILEYNQKEADRLLKKLEDIEKSYSDSINDAQKEIFNLALNSPQLFAGIDPEILMYWGQTGDNSYALPYLIANAEILAKQKGLKTQFWDNGLGSQIMTLYDPMTGQFENHVIGSKKVTGGGSTEKLVGAEKEFDEAVKSAVTLVDSGATEKDIKNYLSSNYNLPESSINGIVQYILYGEDAEIEEDSPGLFSKVWDWATGWAR